jgi:sulfur carrier protein ThiS
MCKPGTMKIKAFIDKENTEKTIELGKNATAKDLLEKLKINPVTVILARKGRIILEDTQLKDKDQVKILSVISGG